MKASPRVGSTLEPTEIELSKIPTQEDQRVPGGNHLVCLICGVPKEPSEFFGDSVICKPCVEIRKLEAENPPNKQNATVFNIILKQLRETSVPALPSGVQTAKEILNGRTSSEILANLILSLESAEGDQFSRTIQAIKLYQRAEVSHDEQLTETNAYKTLDPEDLSAALQKHVVTKMSEDSGFKRWMITEMIERVDGFMNEVVAIARSRAQPTSSVVISD